MIFDFVFWIIVMIFLFKLWYNFCNNIKERDNIFYIVYNKCCEDNSFVDYDIW